MYMATEEYIISVSWAAEGNEDGVDDTPFPQVTRHTLHGRDCPLSRSQATCLQYCSRLVVGQTLQSCLL